MVRFLPRFEVAAEAGAVVTAAMAVCHVGWMEGDGGKESGEGCVSE